MAKSATITVDSDKVDGSGVAFYTILFTGTYDGTGGEPDLRSAANGGEIQNVVSDGGVTGDLTVPADLEFFNDSDLTNQLNHEFLHYDQTTGEISAYIRTSATGVSGSVDTNIYMRWGDYTIESSQENITAVWSLYDSVWHMHQDPSGGADSIKDSATFGNHFSPNGSMDGDDLVDGKIYKALQFDGSDDYLDYSPGAGYPAADSDRVISFWVRVDSTWEDLVTVYSNNADAGIGKNLDVYTRTSDSNEFSVAYNGHQEGFGSAQSTDTWYLIHIRVPSGASQTNDLEYYINGVSQTPSTIAGSSRTLDTAADTAVIAARNASPNDRHAAISVEEVRIADSAFDDDWFLTQFNNENSPSTFYSITNVSGQVDTGLAGIIGDERIY